jgi:hypothetical protein
MRKRALDHYSPRPQQRVNRAGLNASPFGRRMDRALRLIRTAVPTPNFIGFTKSAPMRSCRRNCCFRPKRIRFMEQPAHPFPRTVDGSRTQRIRPGRTKWSFSLSRTDCKADLRFRRKAGRQRFLFTVDSAALDRVAALSVLSNWTALLKK